MTLEPYLFENVVYLQTDNSPKSSYDIFFICKDPKV